MVIVVPCEYSPGPTLVTAWICGRVWELRGSRGEREREREEKRV